MPKVIPPEKRKMNLPSWCIMQSHRVAITVIANNEKRKESPIIQEAMNDFIRKHQKESGRG